MEKILFFLPLLDNFLGISYFILTFEDILKLCIMCLKLLIQKVKLVLPFFWVFNELEVHVGDINRVMGTKGWPMDEV